MKIAIARKGDDVVVVKDFEDIKDSGEIAHFIAELESLKQELLVLWEDYEKL